MDIASFYADSLSDSARVKESTIDACRADVMSAIDVVVDTYRNGGKILFCGNGGSAADCQHLATELMVRLNHDVKRPALGAISLCTDPSNLTACGNDLGFEELFARSVEGLGRAGDLLVGISTSGRSKNVIRAVEKAKSIGMKTLCLLGGTGGELKDLCDVAVVVPSSNTQRIQETHITLGHIICESAESLLYSHAR
jgi:D-sedoheptulose 7-phosphate isomerase